MSGEKYYEQRFLNFFCKPSVHRAGGKKVSAAKPADRVGAPTSQTVKPEPAHKEKEVIPTTVKITPPVQAQEVIETIVETVEQPTLIEESTLNEVVQQKTIEPVEAMLEPVEVKIEKLSEPIDEIKPIENILIESTEEANNTVIENLQNIIDEVVELEHITGSKDCASLPSMIDLPTVSTEALKLNQTDLIEPISPSTAVDDSSYFHGSSGQSADINQITKSEEMLSLKETTPEQLDTSEHNSTVNSDPSDTEHETIPKQKGFGFFNCCAISQKEPELSTIEPVCV